MSWHDALVIAEQAAIWTLVAGVIARILVRRPLSKLARLLLLYAIHQAQTADRLSTDTPGGLRDLMDAIENAGPPPDQPRTKHGRP